MLRVKLYIKKYGLLLGIVVVLQACSPSLRLQKTEANLPPESYQGSLDTSNSAQIKWKEMFSDPFLVELIDSALKNNQELNIMLQQINIAQNEVKARKGEYLPFVGIGAESAVDKVGEYTRFGALEHQLKIKDGEGFPEPFTDFMIGAKATWELDVWKKLRNAKKATVMEYLASVEGKNFMVTNLVAEIAEAYYELLSLDNQYQILEQYIDIQKKALAVVGLQKKSAKVTELAVKRFEAEVLKNRSLLLDVKQQIVEAENEINFLVGRYPQKIKRSKSAFTQIQPLQLLAGVPAQLLLNRPDIRQAEMELEAAKLNVKSARANFYPSIGITADLGFQAFKPEYLLQSPTSLLYNLAGDLMAPLVNRNAIKAQYRTANNKQVQKLYEYEKTILKAYTDVLNLLNSMENTTGSFKLKQQEVDALTESISIANKLFKSARADYMEVLLTQRDALEAKLDLSEGKRDQLMASIKMYQALGGGWK